MQISSLNFIIENGRAGEGQWIFGNKGKKLKGIDTNVFKLLVGHQMA